MSVANNKKIVDIQFEECDLPINTDSLTVAVIQLESSFPNGKHVSVIGGRQTFAWRSLVDMDARIRKACQIIRCLQKQHPKIDLFIFPEYSLPVERALTDLQTISQETGAVIIAGADNIVQPGGDIIYVQSYIILPGRDPYVVTKATLSKWEQGFVDTPSSVTNPIFSWQGNESRYSLAVFPCVDLLLASRALEKLPNTHPGVIVSPMCSPDMDTFRIHSDYLLRNEQGMAVLLANCIGEGACGRSAIHAVTAEGTTLHPALELPEVEAAAVCEIRCNHLVPPRKTVPGLPEALGRRHVYTIRSAGDALTVSLIDNAAPAGQRAVMNPALFDISRKKMRMAFLEVDEFAKVADGVHNAKFEVLAILGQHDIAVTHLHEDEYELIVDINQKIPGRRVRHSGPDSSQEDSKTFPHFEVEVFHKVLGVPVSDEDRGVFERANAQFPTTEELVRIMALGDDWHAPNVTDDDRETFTRNRWILTNTTIQPGKIDAMMTLHLNYADAGITNRLAAFTERVLPALINKPQVTSIYRGTGHSVAMHFVLRISASKESLFNLIDEIHKLATREKILITTSTYLVMKKLSSLDLAAACLSESLMPRDAYYWARVIAPLLSAEEIERAKQIPIFRRTTFISTFIQLKNSVQEIANKPWANRREEFLKRAALGFLFDDLLAVRDLHNLLQERAEKVLTDEIAQQKISEDDLNNWRKLLSIPGGKSIAALTYAERLRLLLHVCTLGRLDGTWEQDLSSLVTDTTQVRNSFTHGRSHELDEAKVLTAIKTYVSFLADK